MVATGGAIQDFLVNNFSPILNAKWSSIKSCRIPFAFELTRARYSAVPLLAAAGLE